MKTIDEAREVLREGQAVLEQNLTATQGQYHDAIDALRVMFAELEVARVEARGRAALDQRPNDCPSCGAICSERAQCCHRCGSPLKYRGAQ